MFFLPVICLMLGLAFFVQGRRQHQDRITGLGLALMFAAAGTAIITFFALNTLG